MEYQIALRNLGHLAFDERSKIVEGRGIFRFDIFEIYNTKFREKVILKGSYQGKVYAPETTYINNSYCRFPGFKIAKSILAARKLSLDVLRVRICGHCYSEKDWYHLHKHNAGFIASFSAASCTK